MRGADAACILLLLPLLHFSFSALRSQDDPPRAVSSARELAAPNARRQHSRRGNTTETIKRTRSLGNSRTRGWTRRGIFLSFRVVVCGVSTTWAHTGVRKQGNARGRGALATHEKGTHLATLQAGFLLLCEKQGGDCVVGGSPCGVCFPHTVGATLLLAHPVGCSAVRLSIRHRGPLSP